MQEKQDMTKITGRGRSAGSMIWLIGERKVLFNDRGCRFGGYGGIVQPEIIGKGDLAGETFTPVAQIIVNQPCIGSFDIPLGGLVDQAVFAAVSLQADLLGCDKLNVVYIFFGPRELLPDTGDVIPV